VVVGCGAADFLAGGGEFGFGGGAAVAGVGGVLVAGVEVGACRVLVFALGVAGGGHGGPSVGGV
jgi:hypothetical protein